MTALGGQEMDWTTVLPFQGPTQRAGGQNGDDVQRWVTSWVVVLFRSNWQLSARGTGYYIISPMERWKMNEEGGCRGSSGSMPQHPHPCAPRSFCIRYCVRVRVPRCQK